MSFQNSNTTALGEYNFDFTATSLAILKHGGCTKYSSDAADTAQSPA
jgi:hypothetical protein